MRKEVKQVVSEGGLLVLAEVKLYRIFILWFYY